jgi:hypothetical protein
VETTEYSLLFSSIGDKVTGRQRSWHRFDGRAKDHGQGDQRGKCNHVDSWQCKRTFVKNREEKKEIKADGKLLGRENKGDVEREAFLLCLFSLPRCNKVVVWG